MGGHSPRPWHWLDYPDGSQLLTCPAHAVIHCPCPMGIRDDDRRLIAAAPDILAALKAFLAYETATRWADEPKSPCGCGRCVAGRAAVAKAEGVRVDTDPR